MQRAKSSSAPVTDPASFRVPSRYKFVKLLGSGSYGTVACFQDSDRGREVAIKRVKRVSDNFLVLRRTLREIRLMRHFKHPNLLRIHKALPLDPGAGDLYMALEIMDCDLDTLVHAKRHPLSDAQVRNYCAQMLLGLLHLHSGHVIHRDLKPANIFVRLSSDLIKIGDLGLSRGVELDGETLEATHPTDEHLTEYVVTRWYRAPEVLLARSKYGPAVDVWSIGCILYELWARKALFPGKNSYDQLRRICSVLGSPSLEDCGWVPKDSQPLLARCCQALGNAVGLGPLAAVVGEKGAEFLERLVSFDPSLRISVQRALEHPYLEDRITAEDLASAKAVSPADVAYDRLYDGVGKSGEAAALPQLTRLLRKEVARFNPPAEAASSQPPRPAAEEGRSSRTPGHSPARGISPSHAKSRMVGSAGDRGVSPPVTSAAATVGGASPSAAAATGSSSARSRSARQTGASIGGSSSGNGSNVKAVASAVHSDKSPTTNRETSRRSSGDADRSTFVLGEPDVSREGLTPGVCGASGAARQGPLSSTTRTSRSKLGSSPSHKGDRRHGEAERCMQKGSTPQDSGTATSSERAAPLRRQSTGHTRIVGLGDAQALASRGTPGAQREAKATPRETPRSARREFQDTCLAVDRLASRLEGQSRHDASSLLVHETPPLPASETPVGVQSEKPKVAPRESLDTARRNLASDRLAQWLLDGLENVKDEVPPPPSARHAIQCLAPAPLRRRSVGTQDVSTQQVSWNQGMTKDARSTSQRDHPDVNVTKPSDRSFKGPISAAAATPRAPPPFIHKDSEEYAGATARPRGTPVVWLGPIGPDEGNRSFGCSDLEASLLSERSPLSGRRECNGSLVQARHSLGGRRDAVAPEQRASAPRSTSRGGISSVPTPAGPGGRVPCGFRPDFVTLRHWQEFHLQRQCPDSSSTPRQWHKKSTGAQSMEILREAAGVAESRPGSAAACASRHDASRSLESLDSLLREAKTARSLFPERGAASDQMFSQRQANGLRASSSSSCTRAAAAKQGGIAQEQRQVQPCGAHLFDQAFTPRPATSGRTDSRRQLSHDELDFALPIQGRTAPPAGFLASPAGRTSGPSRPEGPPSVTATPRHEGRKIAEDLGCIPASAPPPRTGRNSVKDLLEAEQQWRSLQSSFNAALGFAAMAVGTPAQDHRLLHHSASGPEAAAMWAAPRPLVGMGAGPVH